MAKIAVYAPFLRGGGAERAMASVARGLAERGHRVDLVLAKAEGPFLAEVGNLVRVVDLNSPHVINSLPGLIRYMKTERPQAMLSTLERTNIAAIWARSVSGIPVRLVIRVANMVRYFAGAENSWKAKLIRWTAKKFYHKADLIVAVCQGVAEDVLTLTKVSPSKVRVIHNPVVTEKLFQHAQQPLEHPWFAAGEPPVILSVGRLVPQKDYVTLLEAFALLRQRYRARLMLLGEGPERQRLDRLARSLGISEDFSMPGFAENVFPYMKHASVFVLSSRFEGLANVLIEALALGTRVVATRCPSGPEEILEGGKLGFLVPVGDPYAMCEAIQKVLDGHYPVDPETLTVRIIERFAFERIISQYEEALLG